MQDPLPTDHPSALLTTQCNPTKSNSATIISITGRPAILREVISITLSTTESPHRISKSISEEGSGLTPTYQHIIQSLHLFPNLCEIIVQFSQIIDIDTDGILTLVPKNQECIEARYKTLHSLFSALNNPHHPPPHLHSLTLKNLPQSTHAHFASNINAKAVLSRLSSLHLHLLHDFSEYGSFFSNLPSTFLSPTQTNSNLTSLSLHVDVYWGYFPRYDIRSCGRFPNLKKLELGNYTFTHLWALSWILEHEGLEELVLRDCSIVNYFYYYGMLDEEHNIPLTIPEGAAYDPEATGTWEYGGQWSDYFAKIVEGLRDLRAFNWEFGIWERGRGYRESDRGNRGLRKEAYVAFNMREGVWPWLSLEAFEWTAQWTEDWVIPIINRNVVKKEEDDAVLERLMKVVKAKRSGR